MTIMKTSPFDVPSQRFMDGAIVGEDLNHPSIEHIVSKFGMKIAHLVAEKKREITHQGPQTAYSTAVSGGGIISIGFVHEIRWTHLTSHCLDPLLPTVTLGG